MSAPTAEQTVQELEQRMGPLCDLAGLAKYCQVSRVQLRHILERDGVPIIDVGRKQLVPRDLAEKTLGLDHAETLMEIHRNAEWMRERELTTGGRRKTVREYADEMDVLAANALNSLAAADDR